MILCSINDWVELEGGEEYDLVEFEVKIVRSSFNGNFTNEDEALFGMSCDESFWRLKGGIAWLFGIDTNAISLFWENCELRDEDTPNTVGMQTVIENRELLEIHIVSENIEYRYTKR